MNAAVTRMTFGQLAGGIRARCAERGRSRIVGVDGMSGAGKTGFAQRLAAELGAPCLCTDDFVPGWDGLEESVRLLVNWVLRPLAEGRPARWQRYDWMAGCPGARGGGAGAGGGVGGGWGGGGRRARASRA